MDNEIDLVDLFNMLWKKKIFILVGTLIITLFVYFFLYFLPTHYEVSTLFVTSPNNYKMMLPEYKRNSSLFLNNSFFKKYIKSNIKERKLQNFLKRIKLSTVLTPVYSFTKEELLKMGRINRDEKNFIVGVRIKVKSKNLAEAKLAVSEIGKFIKDSIFYLKFRNFLSDLENNNRVLINSLNKEESGIYFKIKVLEEKKNLLSKLLSKYSSFTKVYEKQLIPMNKESFNYISPVIQLIGVESEIADLKVKLMDIARQRKRAELTLEFIGKIKNKVKKVESGKELLKIWNYEFDNFFKENLGDNSLNREVRCSLQASVLNIENIYYKKMGIPPDTIKIEQIRYPVKKITFLVFFFSFLLFSFIALLIERKKEEK